jgi:hypothetical protein
LPINPLRKRSSLLNRGMNGLKEITLSRIKSGATLTLRFLKKLANQMGNNNALKQVRARLPMDVMPNVVIIRQSISNAFGHGGEKRSFQLESIINGFAQSTAFAPPHPDRRPWLEKYDVWGTFKKTVSEHNFKLPFQKYKLVRYQSKNQLTELALSNPRLKHSNTIIWESTFPEYKDFPKLISGYGNKKIIACPQNLESLVDQPYFHWKEKDKITRLSRESSYLRNCSEVFTIAEEDQWLLQLLGIKAKYLPYYPEGLLLKNLLMLRECRVKRNADKNRTKQFLILGSATNAPTKRGMQDLLEKISKEKFFNISFQVAGFGTDCFSKFASNNIIVHGQININFLEELMLQCEAVIVNQGFSTGALTKIIEFLVAGIPVICDEGSVRSYRRFSGVHSYTSISALKEILNDENLRLPDLPEKPFHYYESFTKAVLD